jgi:hypothetical protein
MNPSTLNPRTREALLAQLARITTLERGTLAEEYRERPAPKSGGTVRLGPYFKHQCWEQGRNSSRRVPNAEVERLREDLQNGQRFDQITSELATLAIAEGRAQRAAFNATQAPEEKESKKNSTKRRSRKDTAKPKPSSRKSRRASRSRE